MGRQLTAWEDRFSELGISKSTGTAMFLELQRKRPRKSWLIGSKTKEPLQGSPTRKDIALTLSGFRIESSGFRMETASAPGRPFERACHYRKIHGHCNVSKSEKRQTGSLGSKEKGNLGCT
jgi:hypothetical protein